MGGIAEVDLTQLRAVADRVMDAADRYRRNALADTGCRRTARLGGRRHRRTRAHRRTPQRRRREHAGWATAARMSADRVRGRRDSQRRPLHPAVTRPTVAQAEGWRPDALRRLADDWDEAARNLRAHVDAVVSEVKASRDFWTGSAADSAHEWCRHDGRRAATRWPGPWSPRPSPRATAPTKSPRPKPMCSVAGGRRPRRRLRGR